MRFLGFAQGRVYRSSLDSDKYDPPNLFRLNANRRPTKRVLSG